MAVKASAVVTLSCVVDVTACYRYYLLQSSTLSKPSKPTANPPGGSWTDSEPTYTAGSTNSLYIVDLTVFSNGTFAYSAVSLSSSYEAAKLAYNKAVSAQTTADNVQTSLNGLAVGGRNLVIGTGAEISFEESSDWVATTISKQYVLSPLITDDPKSFLLSLKDKKCLTLSFDVDVPYAYINSGISLNRIGCYAAFKFKNNTTAEETSWYSLHSGPQYTTAAHNYFSANPLVNLNSSNPDNPDTRFVGHYSGYTVPSENSVMQAFYSDPDDYTVTASYLTADIRGYTKGGTIRNIKLEVGNIETTWTPAPEDYENEIADVRSNTEVIVGTQTAATGSWTGTASFSTLKDGQQIVYWLPYAGFGNASLNLTLADGSTTGAIACYYSGTTRLTTHYAAGNAIHLTYRKNAVISGSSTTYTGWWSDANYNTDTYDRVRLNNSITAKSAVTAGRLIVGDGSGFFHLGASVSFDVNKPILYAGSAITAAATGTNNYLSMSGVNLRTTLGNSSWTATKGAACYIAGTLSGTTFTTLSSDYITTAAETENVVYISLGYMYSTYQLYLYPEHPMFRYIGGTLKAVSQISYEAQLTADTANSTASSTAATVQRALRFDADSGLHIGDNQTANEVLIDSESVNIVMNGQKYSKFAANYVQFGKYQLRKSADGGLVFKLKS